MFSGANGLHSKIINPPPTAEQADSPAVAPKNRKINFTPRPLGATPPQQGMVDFGGGVMGKSFGLELFWGLGGHSGDGGYLAEIIGSTNFSLRSGPA